MSSKSIVTKENTEASTVAAQQVTPMAMLQMALEQGADLEKMQQLMDLQERWENNEARKAYVSAMNQFKQDPPDVYKNKHVSYGQTKYDHASLDHVSEAIGKRLAEYSLSHRWDVEQQEGGVIKVTCVITHALGHSESVPMQAGADQSGAKNNIQAIGSTITYLQRYTLLSATGLAVKDMDTDAITPEKIEYVTEEQAANIQALADEVGANMPNFFKYLQVKSIDAIRATEYERAIKLLELKRGK